MSEGEQLDTEIKISEYLKDNPTHRFKSYTIVIVFIVIILGLVFLTGAYGPDFFGFVIFIVIVSFPVLILFKYKLVSILPKSLSDKIIDMDYDDTKQIELDVNIKKFRTPKLVKEILVYVVIILLMVGSILLMKKAHEEYILKSSVIYILGSLVCLIIAGITLLDIDEPITINSNPK
jgi:hypothetical protein